MRIGFWDPFLAAYGGGEKYLLTIMEDALALSRADVVLLAEERPEPEGWRRLGVSIDPGAFEWWAAGEEKEVTERSAKLDLLVVTANDVPPLSRARRSVAVVQFPHRNRTGLRHRALDVAGLRRTPAALASYDAFLCYSEFVRRHIADRLGVDATVLPPPVDVPASEPPPKGDTIVSVGRFFRGWHDKRQDVLIDAFSRLPGRESAELHLVGGLDPRDPGAAGRLKELRERAAGLPVSFHVDVARAALEERYGEAALCWHAAGYGQSERRHPERLEHFGLTTVEAMAHGAVPLVYGAGGQAEIVEDGRTGVLWRTVEELVAESRRLLDDDARRSEMAGAARAAAHAYSRERFAERVRSEVLRA